MAPVHFLTVTAVLFVWTLIQLRKQQCLNRQRRLKAAERRLRAQQKYRQRRRRMLRRQVQCCLDRHAQSSQTVCCTLITSIIT